MPVRRIEFTEYDVLFGKQIRRLDCETQYAVLIRKFDTSYPTGGYDVSGEVEDDDDGDTYDIWDITVKDVERIRQFLMPNVPDEIDELIHTLIPQPIHTTLPNDDYVAPATKSILDELLEEIGDEIMNVTMDDEKAAKDP
ncbi:hypothetical protein Tco_0702926 [Tanacetum coccineum]|uniref:Uncharacterized protein n=1 Tax=Tanacetum coccineum TaxID=301880 RepID=A0ABQ4XYE8_9ASTR